MQIKLWYDGTLRLYILYDFSSLILFIVFHISTEMLYISLFITVPELVYVSIMVKLEHGI